MDTQPTRLADLAQESIDPGIARALAARYLRAVCDEWRGRGDRHLLEAWLSGFHDPALPAAPARPADAVSPHGGGGRGIHWYVTPSALEGHIAGQSGGYRIPLHAIEAQLAVMARDAPLVPFRPTDD